jgi:small-conductance mechanosensitive channel
VSNANIFDDPVYNYSHEFPYIWEEMRLPVPYTADRQKAEQILLGAAHKHTADIAKMSAEDLRELERRYVMSRSELHPEVYWRLTDNWLEMTLRFIVPTSGIRKIKSDMSREIITALDHAGIGIASGTYEVVGMPPLKVQVVPATTEDQGRSATA